MKKKITIILAISVLVCGLLLLILNRLFSDKNSFEQMNKDLATYISSNFNSAEKSQDTKYCTRNHLKYSTGRLNCAFELNYKLKTNLTLPVVESKIFDNVSSSLEWTSNGANTQSLQEETGKDVVRGETYRKDNRGCTIYLVKESSNEYTVYGSCDGSAAWTWYPMRN